MTALQAQAAQMMESMPDQAILAIIKYMENYNNHCHEETKNPFSEKEWQQFIYGDGTKDTKKRKAFAAMEVWKKEHKNYFDATFDCKRELLEAMDEKYGIVD